jgi:hypothetical protein
MPRLCRHAAMFVLSFAAVLAFCGVPDASAQKKMTYAQAFALCKKDVVAGAPGELADSTQRYLRGTSCMRKHGFTLKTRDTKSF